jgi:hypothetical protein
MKYLKYFLSLVGLWAFASFAQAATLTLSPTSGSFNPGDMFEVSVNLDTQGADFDGVDLRYLNYDKSRLEVVDADAAASGVQMKAGNLMPQTLDNKVESLGKIIFSQIPTVGTKYKGSGVLATVTFKVIAGGTANVNLSYASGNTTDSNIASAGQDILTSVNSAAFTLSGPPPVETGRSTSLRLVNSNGTFYLIDNGQRRGITNPGMLNSYGFTFAMAKTATQADMALPEGRLLTPGDGALVKSKEDQTVYLISGQQRYAFTSAQVFGQLGFKFSSVLVVTNPELQALPKAAELADGAAKHLPGLDINKNGTVYYVGADNKLYGYPSLAVYNSWHIPNDFSRVVPANSADMTMPMGDVVGMRILE